MTDPNDDTQPHPSASDAPAAPAAPPAATNPAATDPAAATPASATGGPADEPATGAAQAPGSAGEPPLRADPDRPADSGWREPAWFPPNRRDRDRRPGVVALVVGLVLIAVGLYYFLDRTLQVPMPRIQWSSLWPIVLIVIGVLVLLRSFQRKA